jgi:hypothetical protein
MSRAPRRSQYTPNRTRNVGGRLRACGCPRPDAVDLPEHSAAQDWEQTVRQARAGSWMLGAIWHAIWSWGAIISAACLPAALVAGLLTFPTACACGDALPHEHALFALADHRHASTPGESDHGLMSGNHTGPSMQMMPTSASEMSDAAVISPDPCIVAAPPVTRIATRVIPPTGVVSMPASPPPRP